MFLALFLTGKIQAQTPNLLNFQGVARNSAGNLVTNSAIKVRASIKQGSANGSTNYTETRSVNTNANGIFSLEIGSYGATNTTGSISGINWTAGGKFLVIEIDPSNGTNFFTVSSQQLTTVPFAKVAESALSFNPNGQIQLNQISPGSGSSGKFLRFNGTNWVFGSIFTQAGSLYFPMAASANVASPGTAFSISNSGNGAGVKLVANGSGNAMNASSISGAAVYALTANIAPTVTSTTTVSGGTAVLASSTGGSGLKAVATGTGGRALEVKGKVILNGGNMNPSKGAFLTSDASGNAVWKGSGSKMGVEFGLYIPSGKSEESLPNSYSPSPHFNDNCKCFTIPASGVYKISGGTSGRTTKYSTVPAGNVPDLKELSLIVRLKRNGSVFQTLVDRKRAWFEPTLYLNTDIASYVYLKQGDVVEPRVFMETLSDPIFLNRGGFLLTLVMAD